MDRYYDIIKIRSKNLSNADGKAHNIRMARKRARGNGTLTDGVFRSRFGFLGLAPKRQAAIAARFASLARGCEAGMAFGYSLKNAN